MCYYVLFICWVLGLSSCNHCILAQNQTQHCEGNTSCSGTNNDPQPKITVDFDSPSPDCKNSKKEESKESSDTTRDGFDVYQSKIEFARKMKEGRKAVDQTLRSSSNEHCDWRVSPLKYLKGEYCGKHYKIFGLNRHFNESTKEIKKRYRKLSLLLHPDKNPAQEAPRAFSALTDGYNCLMSSECKGTYDEHLHMMERQEVVRRETQLRQVAVFLQRGLENMFYYVSWAATSIDQGKLN
jgi:hypothetical protein